VHDSGSVAHLEVSGRTDVKRGDAARQEDAYARDWCGPELRPWEVVEDDLVVEDALLGVAVRAPLAQADAVSPTVAGDEERRGAGGNRLCVRAGTRSRAGGEHENGDEDEGSTHQADPSKDATEASKGPHQQDVSLRNPHLIVCATGTGANPFEVVP